VDQIELARGVEEQFPREVAGLGSSVMHFEVEILQSLVF
jgi:hypothetical protein